MSSKITKSIGAGIATVFLFSLPLFVLAAGESGGTTANDPQIINDGDAQGKIFGITYECNHEKPGECTFADLVAATLFLVNWGTKFALGFSVIVIAYAGFKFMISGDNQGERTKAKKMLWSVVIGIVIIIAAWLIVRLIATAFSVNVGITNLTTPGVPNSSN